MIVRRSTLIVPAHVSRFVDGAAGRGADQVMLDLEDSVAPSAKQDARDAVRDAIPKVAAGGSRVAVRVNHDSWRQDVEAALWPGLSSIGFPKAESGAEVRALSEALDALEAERGLAPGSVAVSPAIETLRGVEHAEEIATASPRVRGIGGPAPVDFATDLGIELDPTLDQLEPARGQLDLLSRALGGAGVGRWRSGQVITEYGEAGAAARRAAAAAARRDGGRGSTGIHPSVVAAFNEGYTPPADEVDETRELVAALEAADAAGRGWATVRGRRVSLHSLGAAREYLRFAEACAQVDASRGRGRSS